MTLFHLRTPLPEKIKLFPPKLVILAFIFTAVFSTSPAAYGYIDPASGNRSAQKVLKGFKKPEYNWLPGHRGVDLDLAVGANVLAAETGIVAFSGAVAGTPTLSIDHPDGIRTTYQPVFTVLRKGDSVQVGDVIGQLAPSTNGDPGLHWGAFTGHYDYVNPLSLLDAPTIRGSNLSRANPISCPRM
ncbi:M23 family metallopeptidase [Corynebacterium silvaticum]|uniref:M23 family metallopeptidase n=1 Tax=Corynebacterium silvaticum TaxID=2320431 RepID=A0A7Y4LG63_9CORY|nr:M23 family metallopeptidase [Corynebacterium silvaticum]ARU46381.1 M23 family metallopeptidase [Corynebacterium silvaticum]MBH5299518.1 M23 family metallopeptidase [Corynebacterium silvaticum]NOM64163.1 M23 family metallopeptidase [Corynebacterium silvaticum]NON69370.1 M23 family metallopeptidase [Corynebacterium silvaticum]TFA94008.1 M23 family metallopeptidase [Corynebacterium silvaticum]